jgi:hypothetical protein
MARRAAIAGAKAISSQLETDGDPEIATYKSLPGVIDSK